MENIVQRLKESNPYRGMSGRTWDNRSAGFYTACNELEKLLQQPGESTLSDSTVQDSRIDELEYRFTKCLSVLQELCQLKHYKDTVGKDSIYEKRQPQAWKAANEFLNSIARNESPPQPVQKGSAGVWVKCSDRKPESNIWRVRFHERGTHSIDPTQFEETQEAEVLRFRNGETFLKTNVEWLDESQQLSAPSPAKEVKSAEEPIECTSEDGITIGLIDAVLTIFTLLQERDFLKIGPVREAITDLRDSDSGKRIMGIGELSSAKERIKELEKVLSIISKGQSLSKDLEQGDKMEVLERLLRLANGGWPARAKQTLISSEAQPLIQQLFSNSQPESNQ